MRTRNGSDEITPLPPAPAPPARDANPWRLPELDRPTDAAPPARRPRRRQEPPGPERAPQRRIALAAGIALLVLGVVVFRLMGGEDIGDVAQSLFPVLIIVIVFASRLRRRQRKLGETRKKG
jgi:Flp pilus assembly protein TadB